MFGIRIDTILVTQRLNTSLHNHIPLLFYLSMPPRRKRADSSDEFSPDEDGEDEPMILTDGPTGRRSSKFSMKNAKRPRIGGTGSSSGNLSSLKKSSIDAIVFNDELEFRDYSKELSLKPDHDKRPIWVTKDNLIYLEAFSPLYQQACDFLVAIAEPESRPEFIHTYKLTQNSLYAAVAVSITTENIIKVLSRLCKTNLPPEVERFIRDSTYTFGKAKLVLKDNNFYIESQFPAVLKELLANPDIAAAREVVNGDATLIESSAPVEDSRSALAYQNLAMDILDAQEDDGIDQPSMAAREFRTVSFMVQRNRVQDVKRYAKDGSNYPLMEEYDFKNDHRNANLSIDLRATTRIRPYQEKALSKMFGNGRARSGIIVLPCGAGKSLTGITAAQTVKKSTVVMCINNASVYQWRDEFLRWTNIAHDRVKVFTSERKEELSKDHSEACVLISTYSMVSHGGPRSREGQKMIDRMQQREWGLMILDEVHVASADHFQRVVDLVNAHCKLGLSATLVREDNRIQDLAFIVGPKLYEANWIDLTNQGYLARVQCTEVWCPMTKEFYTKYIEYGAGAGGVNSSGNNGAPSARDSRLQRLLYTLNPTKFRVCEYLVKYHSQRGDKIILFSDDVPALIMYCEALKPVCEVPYIHGGTPSGDRNMLLAMFRTRAEVKCLGLSKVGDTALDIPDANVIIQVSSHFGARRQEAQRLGRILRPKPNPTGDFNAFFYTLVSTDTKEMYFSNKRQQYLIDQGYTFKVDQRIAPRANVESQILNSLQKEVDLLAKVTSWQNFGLDDADDKGEDDEEERGNAGITRTHHRSMDSITGAGGSYYVER